MDQRTFIQNNYVKLTKAISPNIESVVAFLYSKGVISQQTKEILINKNQKDTQTRALLDIINERGPRALDELYNAVVSEQMYEAADILKLENAPHERNMVAQPQPQSVEYDSPDEGLPDTWPSAEAIGAYKSARLVEVKHTRMIKLFKDHLTPKGQDITYLMSAKPRGQVLIINNEEFTHLPKRDGSLADRMSLEKLFDALDFDVIVEKNLTKERMWKLLEEESRRDYHNTAQCFMLFILSHGHTGVVFGTDGHMIDGRPVNCLEIKDITDLFCRSKALQGKPKLFFIQACQGDEMNEGHPVGEADGNDRAASQQPAAAAPAASRSVSAASKSVSAASRGTSAGSRSASDCIRLNDEEDAEQMKIISEAKTTLNEVISTTQADAAGDKRPSGADVFVALATIPGFLSYRNKGIGTWFIQAICYVFAKYAYKHELNKLMILVNNLVGKAETETGRYKQVCEKKDSFQKEFYFFPGLFDQR